MNLLQNFPERLEQFIRTANKNKVKMILVGGGAVNFHGYQRHSADIDFWVEVTETNLLRLLKTLREMEYQIPDLPEEVKTSNQNISIKISPVLDLELITSFNPGKTFEEAFEESIQVEKDNLMYRVLSFNDLILSKISTDRIKDKLDIEELQKIQLKKNNT
jgi:predicted nucleotidyltransferase